VKAPIALAVVLLATPVAALPQAQNQGARHIHTGTNTHIFRHVEVAKGGIGQVPLGARMRMAHANCAVDHCYRIQIRGQQFTWTRTDTLNGF